MTTDHFTELARTWGFNSDDPNFQGTGGLVKWFSYRLAVAARLEEEGDLAHADRLQFTRSWWGARMAEMDAWIREHGDEATKLAYFSILANGATPEFRRQVGTEGRAVYLRLLTDLDEARKREAGVWLDAPNAAGFWWWDNGREIEMVEARDLGRGHICLYSCSKGWGGHTLDMAKEHLKGLWKAVVKPEPNGGAAL